jgi:transposase
MCRYYCPLGEGTQRAFSCRLWYTNIEEMIESNPDWNEKDKILQSVPGVGAKASQTLIVSLSELGELNRQKIASLVGVASHCQDSGKWSGTRRIKGGRAEVRSALYMASLNVIRFNKTFKEFYERLIAKRKKFKVAIVAVMRKMIIKTALTETQSLRDKNAETSALCTHLQCSTAIFVSITLFRRQIRGRRRKLPLVFVQKL